MVAHKYIGMYAQALAFYTVVKRINDDIAIDLPGEDICPLHDLG